MNIKELKQLIKNGENSHVEFKNADVSTNDLAYEIAAFANFEGGVILLGIDDDGNISGIKRNDMEEYLMNICRNNISPGIIPSYEKIVTEEGDVVALSIPKGISKPYSVNGKHYIRVGSTKRIATREELERLFQLSGDIHYDISPVYGTGIKNLDLEKIRDYFMKYNLFDIYDESEESKINILTNADILKKQEEKINCTVGGLLIFGRDINKYLPQSGISFAHFNGNDITSELLDKKSITGTLPEQVEKMMDVFSVNILRPSQITGAKREEKEYYPKVALREALVNAVVHRNYQIKGSKIRVFMFKDRIEFRSPGRLPNTVTIEKMKIGVSYARNPFLVKYMENLRYIDQLGRGIPMIFREMKGTGAREPKLELSGEEFILTIFSVD